MGLRLRFDYFDQISLLPCCAGLFMLARQLAALAWSWPARRVSRPSWSRCRTSVSRGDVRADASAGDDRQHLLSCKCSADRPSPRATSSCSTTSSLASSRRAAACACWSFLRALDRRRLLIRKPLWEKLLHRRQRRADRPGVEYPPHHDHGALPRNTRPSGIISQPATS